MTRKSKGVGKMPEGGHNSYHHSWPHTELHRRERREQKERRFLFFYIYKTELRLRLGHRYTGCGKSTNPTIYYYNTLQVLAIQWLFEGKWVILPSGQDPGHRSCRGPCLQPGRSSSPPPGYPPWRMQGLHRLQKEHGGKMSDGFFLLFWWILGQ